jgi:hypothetical protein
VTTAAGTAPNAGLERSAIRLGDLARRGFRLTHANPVAPLAGFLLVAPLFAGNALGEVRIMLDKAGGAGLPAAAIEFTSLLRRFWNWVFLPLLVTTLLVAFPWVAGGAAGRFAEEAEGPVGRRQSFIEHANRLWGRLVLLVLVYLVFMAACTVLQGLLRTELAPPPPLPSAYDEQLDAFARYGHEPRTLAVGALLQLLGAVLMTASMLCLAAIGVEDCGPLRAVRRGVSFVREHLGTAARLYLLVALLTNVPTLLSGEVGLLVRHAGSPLALLLFGFASVACSSYMLAVSLAAAVSAYAALRGAARQVPVP